MCPSGGQCGGFAFTGLSPSECVMPCTKACHPDLQSRWIFKVDLLPAVRNAVQLQHTITVEGQMLATLYPHCPAQPCPSTALPRFTAVPGPCPVRNRPVLTRTALPYLALPCSALPCPCHVLGHVPLPLHGLCRSICPARMCLKPGTACASLPYPSSTMKLSSKRCCAAWKRKNSPPIRRALCNC